MKGARGRVIRSPFVLWGTGGYLLTTTVLLIESLRVSHGKLVYLIDDPAIHLSMARTLADSGTWGVVPGHFEAASSAPLWTATLALIWRISPSGAMWAPIILNVVASIAVIVLLDRNQDLFRPSRNRPLDGVAIIVLIVAVLFLPALTLLGMEHVTHIALVLAIVTVFHRNTDSDKAWPGWTLVVLLAVASLVRFETAFVATGLAVATLAGTDRSGVRNRVVRSGSLLAASGIPIALFGLVNHLAGQGWLPNSVLAKGQVVSKAGDSSLSITAALGRLTTDPVLAFLMVVGLAVVVAGWRRTPSASTAIVFVVACALHVTVAQVGWFERYQSYLVALGVITLLQLGTELHVGLRWAPSKGRSYRIALAALVILPLCVTKITLTKSVPRGVRDTYQQRYQAARFLHRYYDHEPVATGELGYISLMHDGPITDLYGLGDYHVLRLRQEHAQKVPPAQWDQLARTRGFEVVAVYPLTLFLDTPKNWILVGTWTMPHSPVTAFENEFQFWATTPEAVAPLERHLKAFESSLPAGVESTINQLASYRAAVMLQRGR